MVEEIGFENGRNSKFQGLVTLTSTLDPVIRHTVVHHSSTSTYIPNFIEIEETFCGRTDGRMDVRTDGHFPPLILLGRLLEVDLKISNESSPPLYNICSVMTIWKLKGEIIRTALYHILWTLISAVPKLIQDQCVLSSSFIFSVRSCFPQEGSFICFGISCVSFMFSLVLGVRLLVPIQLTE